jgi:F-type H+-transporting ATPase subunit gamma
MKLVAAAKLRKAQDSVTASRAYRNALNELLAELVAEAGNLDVVNPLLTARESVKTVRLLVVGGSRGLCGAYNSNVNRRVDAFMKERQAKGIEVETVILGRKPAEFFRRVRRPYLKSYETLPEDAPRWPIDEIAGELEEGFVKGDADEVYILYTRFKSALSMSVVTEKLLPMDASMVASMGAGKKREPSGVTLFEPSIAEVFAAALPRILRSNILQAALDAKASEQGSRMTAMEAATKNAGDLSRRLQLTYNKVRQLRITSELLDIIGGSEAIS